MTHEDIVFFFGRVLLAALCFHAAHVGWKLAQTYTDAPDRRQRSLAGTAILIINGVLHLVTGAEEGWGQAGNPIPWIHWAWLVIDILVPVFFLRMLAAMRQRDALERALAAAAERDPLTGLANRAGFSRMGLVALAQAARQDEASVAVMLDIDHFKRVNDGWGHTAGDAVLRAVAREAQGVLRQQDLLGRHGGEEFALLLPATTPQAALAMVDRLRQAITQGVPHPGAPEHRLTLSAGIARIHGAGVAGMERAFDQADRALYAAKQAGRDRAVLARGLDGLDAAC